MRNLRDAEVGCVNVCGKLEEKERSRISVAGKQSTRG
jgi:hypothetical protein